MSPFLRAAALASLAARNEPSDGTGAAIFRHLPAGYSPEDWAFVDTQALAYIPGTFNRSGMSRADLSCTTIS